MGGAGRGGRGPKVWKTGETQETVGSYGRLDVLKVTSYFRGHVASTKVYWADSACIFRRLEHI